MKYCKNNNYSTLKYYIYIYIQNKSINNSSRFTLYNTISSAAPVHRLRRAIVDINHHHSGNPISSYCIPALLLLLRFLLSAGSVLLYADDIRRTIKPDITTWSWPAILPPVCDYALRCHRICNNAPRRTLTLTRCEIEIDERAAMLGQWCDVTRWWRHSRARQYHAYHARVFVEKYTKANFAYV